MKTARAILLLIGLAWSLAAQTTGAGIEGEITDPAGALLANTSLRLRNVKTGATWALTTDESGHFRAPLLPPGEYELAVSAEDFVRAGDAILERIQLAVGDDARLNLAVSVEPGIRRGGVVARINLTSGAMSGLVDDKTIRDLPLNGRSFQQLALLEAGVTWSRSSGTDINGGRMPKISINGARPELNSFLLDGTDIDDVFDKTPGVVAGVLLGVEAVREFRVTTSSYSAEFGRAGGGVVNAVTRSGENALHGSAFEFLRNSALDAKNFFDPLNSRIPAFKRNQFGAAAGGPIRRDKTFFFGTFESLTERLGVTGVTGVPDVNARKGILPSRTVTLHPAIPAYLDLFPLPNGDSLGGGAGEYLFTRSQPTAAHLLQGRVDHRFSAKNNLFGRYTFTDGEVKRQPTNKPPLGYIEEQSRNQYATIEDQYAPSATTVNTVRLGFNRSVQEASNVRTANIPASLSFVPGQPFGFFTITGVVAEVGGDWRLPRRDHLNAFQWEDTLTMTHGRHAVRLGVKGERFQYNLYTISQLGGLLTFASLENFLQGIVQSADIALPGRVDPVRGLRQSLWGAFAQDDIRLKPNLTLNLGVRYEFATVPWEVNGKTANLRDPSDAAVTVGTPWFKNPSLFNVSPRAGLAWDPFRDGRTAIRAGFGMFYDPILSKYLSLPGAVTPPYTLRTSVPNAPFPNVLANLSAAAAAVSPAHAMEFQPESPYMMQYNLAIERTIGKTWSLMAAYVGSRGLHLFRTADANLAPETIVNGEEVYQPQLGRRNPNFGGIWPRVTDAQSRYSALQLGLTKRLAHGLRAQASYSFSRSIDDAAGTYSQDFSNQNPYGTDYYDRRFDKGLSPFHAKNNLTLNWTYNIPAPGTGPGWMRAALRNWQANNISSLQSGHPFTVQLGFLRSGNLNTGFSMNERPNVKPGYTGDPTPGGPDRYWDVNAFELPAVNHRGNLGRNSLIGPGMVAIDSSLTRSFHVSERAAVQFRSEVFNVGNHPNFATPSGRTAFISAAGAVAPDQGRITATTSTSRQIQFALKVEF
jgi:hypothetical protein